MKKKTLFVVAPAVLLMGSLIGCNNSTSLSNINASCDKSFKVNETINKTDITVLAVYSDSSKKTIETKDWNCNLFQNDTYTFKAEDKGQKTFKIEYNGKSSEVYVDVSNLTGSVEITGTTKVGETLTATYSEASQKVSYQWYAVNDAIEGATASTFTLTEAQFGKTIKVRVSGIAEFVGSVESASTGLVTKDLSGTVKIVGSRYVGETLTAVYSTPGETFTYQWYADDELIENATSASYTLTEDEWKKTIKVKITGTGKYSNTIESDATEAVTKNISGTVTITGETTIGEILTATYVGSEDNVEYQWYADDDPVENATSATYELTEDEWKKTIKVKVTGKGEYTGTVESDATNVITKELDGLVNISGTITVGQTLSIDYTAIEDATYGCVWYRTNDESYGGTQISTEDTYTLTSDDSTKYIYVIITGTGNYSGELTSSLIGPVSGS